MKLCGVQGVCRVLGGALLTTGPTMLLLYLLPVFQKFCHEVGVCSQDVHKLLLALLSVMVGVIQSN